MHFRIKVAKNDAMYAKLHAKVLAKQRIYLFNRRVTEALIDKHLKEHFDISLVGACKAILKNARYEYNFAEEIVITIPDPKLNMIAQLITFGTGKLQGSRILKFVLALQD